MVCAEYPTIYISKGAKLIPVEQSPLVVRNSGRRPDNLTGRRFGRLTVTAFVGRQVFPTGKRLVWACECDCGQSAYALEAGLKSGDIQSCGCLSRELSSKRRTKHGLSSHPLRHTYAGMLARCYDPRHPGFKNYGARGITVCDRWRGEQGLENFIGDMGERPKGLTLDRKDNDGNYCPENCKWSTWPEQNKNKRQLK